MARSNADFPSNGSQAEKLEWARKTDKLSDETKLALLFMIDPLFRKTISDKVYESRLTNRPR